MTPFDGFGRFAVWTTIRRFAFPMAVVSCLVLLGGLTTGLVSASDQVASVPTGNAAVTQTSSSDRAALVALYNATDGANWANNTNWLSDRPLGEWHGVSTDSDGRVIRLNLYVNQLTGSIPAELGNLVNLRYLDLDSNQLSGTIPPELGNLLNLDDLSLVRNRLSGEIPSSLGNLSKLRSLYLLSNRLSGPIPPELGRLTNLETLNLRWNQLSGNIPPELVRLTKLRGFYLSGNPLEGCIPQGLSGVVQNDFFSLGLQFCSIPEAPTITSPMIAGPGSLTVAWTAPAVGLSVVAYDLRHIPTEAADIVDANWTVVEDVWTIGFNPLEYVLTGLAASTQYDVQMRAVTATGNGPWSGTVTGNPSDWGAIRSVSSAYVEPGDEAQVTITATGYGESGRVVETLPPSFSFVSSDLDDDAVTVIGQKVVIFLSGEKKFTYTVAASTVGWGYRFIGHITSYHHGLRHQIGGASRIRIQAEPAVYAVRNTSSLVRPNAPIPVSVIFSEPVFRFTVEDIDATNGAVSNFAGSGAVYTCDVTPNAIGEVTVDIAASAATDAEGNGNMAAPQLLLGIPYDDDHDGEINKDEAIAAVVDYFAGRITREQAIAVVILYFTG